MTRDELLKAIKEDKPIMVDGKDISADALFVGKDSVLMAGAYIEFHHFRRKDVPTPEEVLQAMREGKKIIINIHGAFEELNSERIFVGVDEVAFSDEGEAESVPYDKVQIKKE